MLEKFLLAPASPGESPCLPNSSTKGGNVCSGQEICRLNVQNFSLPCWTGASEEHSGNMVVGNRLACSARVEERSIKPRCEPWGLSENLEVGLRKPPAVGKYFSSFPSQLLSFSSIFLGAFYLLFSSTLESQLDLLSDFQLLNNVAHSVDTKTWFLTSFAAETTAPFSTPISHDARSKI
jgi:hypothetical protein